MGKCDYIEFCKDPVRSFWYPSSCEDGCRYRVKFDEGAKDLIIPIRHILSGRTLYWGNRDTPIRDFVRWYLKRKGNKECLKKV